MIFLRILILTIEMKNSCLRISLDIEGLPRPVLMCESMNIRCMALELTLSSRPVSLRNLVNSIYSRVWVCPQELTAA